MKFTGSSLLAILPWGIIFVGACTLLFFSVVKKFEKWFQPVLFSTLGLAFLTTLFAMGTSFPSSSSISFAAHDTFATLFQLFFCFLTVVICLVAPRYFEIQKTEKKEFYVLLLFCLFGMNLLVSAQDLLLTYVALETMSIAIYLLTSFFSSSTNSQEAGLKFFFSGVVASAILLMGMAYLFGATGTISFAHIGSHIASVGISKPYATLGATLVIIGFGFKVAAVPFHFWLPDVVEGSPSPISLFLSVGVQAAVFAVFTRLICSCFSVFPGVYLAGLLGVLSLGTMLWGNIAALLQTNIKRMLAYASIGHVGYILLALASVKTSNIIAGSVNFYFFSYLLMVTGAFLIVMIFEKKEGKHLDIHAYQGMAKRYPLLAICFSIFLLSLAGLPPTIGFVARWYLFVNAVATGETWFLFLTFVAALTTLLSTYCFGRIVFNMFMKGDSADTVTVDVMYFQEKHLLIFLSVLVLVLGIFPRGVMYISSTAKLSRASTLPQRQKPKTASKVPPKKRPSRQKPPQRRAKEKRTISLITGVLPKKIKRIPQRKGLPGTKFFPHDHGSHKHKHNHHDASKDTGTQQNNKSTSGKTLKNNTSTPKDGPSSRPTKAPKKRVPPERTRTPSSQPTKEQTSQKMRKVRKQPSSRPTSLPVKP